MTVDYETINNSLLPEEEVAKMKEGIMWMGKAMEAYQQANPDAYELVSEHPLLDFRYMFYGIRQTSFKLQFWSLQPGGFHGNRGSSVIKLVAITLPFTCVVTIAKPFETRFRLRS
ncbi:hypothetical protein CKAN_00491600 [Cinnamomum micranthum f. kanehirae]|uniref:Uncharacterized protein n=1 Tax=Cinnamomum micranthum f. kanehirae TaxID=337451 RepID=A0A443ND71_9MAGN|nr:hypothetical protein CKAN_00491600 [Cinnamomum micranthum f. kanehirae]